MKNLELKDICSYLPYGLKCASKQWKEPMQIVGVQKRLVYIECLVDDISNIKPYLYSMDWITKEITHKGETFVPIVELGKLCGYDKLEKYEEDAIITYGWCDCNGDDYSGYTFSWYEKDRCFAIWGEEIEGEPYYLTNTVLSVYDKLSEWMFDFHGLIDADLALPVTEEFNPYKL